MMQAALKRALDMLGAALLLLALSPLLVTLALLILANMGRPVFFRQQRIGRHEKPFGLVKFRTMLAGDKPDAERLTPFGSWLRRTSLDELPELWNILIGDMSFVGPRPLLPRYLPFYTPREATRHAVRPGLTGLAQVNGRNAVGWDERLALDAEYVERFSLKRDVEIVLRTVRIVLGQHGISAEGEATMQALDIARGARP